MVTGKRKLNTDHLKVNLTSETGRKMERNSTKESEVSERR